MGYNGRTMSVASPQIEVNISVVVRPATPADYDAAMRLFRYTMGENFTLLPALWDEVCNAPNYRTLVGDDAEGVTIALAVVVVSDRIRLAAGLRRRRFHMDELIVAPDYRSHGIGHQMLEHIRSLAAAEAPSYIIANCDFMNVAARRVYEDAGLHLTPQGSDRFEIAFS